MCAVLRKSFFRVFPRLDSSNDDLVSTQENLVKNYLLVTFHYCLERKEFSLNINVFFFFKKEKEKKNVVMHKIFVDC